MKKSIIGVLVWFAMCTVSFGETAQSVDRVIAVVGDSVILYSDVVAYTEMKLQQSGGGDALLKNALFEPSLNELIDGRVMVVYADNDTNITVSNLKIQDMVEERIAGICAQNKITTGQLVTILQKEQGMTLTEFRAQLAIQIKQEMIQQQVQQFYITDRDLSRKEVREFYDAFQDSLPSMGESVRLQKLEIKLEADSLARQKTYDQILQIRRNIVDKDAEFQEMARLYSQSPNAIDGGDLGFVSKGTLTLIRLEAAAFSLAVGEISQPIETKLGFHLLTISERRDGRVHVWDIFIPVSAPEEKVQSAFRLLDSISFSEPSYDAFVEAVKLYSTDEVSSAYSGELGWEALSSLDKNITESFSAIEVGITGLPIREENTVFLYRIADYHKNRPMDFDADYENIARIATQIQSQEKLRDLIKRWRDDVFIKIYDTP